MVPQRDATLQDEMRKQQNNEALRRQFADKANQVGPWIERQMDAVSALGMGMQVSVWCVLIIEAQVSTAFHSFRVPWRSN